jgi:exonuclease III
MRFGTWNVRSLNRSGSLTTVARELARYKLDLVGVQEVRWDKGGTV